MLPEAEEPTETVATPVKPSKIPLKDTAIVQCTPKQNTPIRPAPEEMHPGHHQSTTTKPLEEARWLGFMEKGAQTEPPKGSSKIPMMQNTPSKVPKMPGTFSPPEFQFTFRHPSLELSPAAKRMMEETRAEAAKIRANMSSEDSGLLSIQEQIERKIATPKGRAGRFSDAHMTEFKKMDSIMNHASSFRADPSRFKQTDTSLKQSNSKLDLDKSEQPTIKNLKRSNSKIDLDESADNKNYQKPVEFKVKTTGLEAASPAKRFKARYQDDSTATRPISRDGSQQSSSSRLHGASHLPSVTATPTKSSLARSDSIKSIKTGIPSLARSPSKSTVDDTSGNKPASVSLLARSPSKKAVSSHAESHAVTSSPPLLARSPSKKPAPQRSSSDEEGTSNTPLLSRSPSKKSTSKVSNSDDDQPQAPSTPLLSRSPSKKAVSSSHDHSNQSGAPSNIPLLSRTPAKIPVPDDTSLKETSKPTQTPAAPSSSLRSRFSALRGASSAMKSILRSPQRLYSDDPFKIAAGTHVAVGTPPRSIAKLTEHKEPPTVPSVRKHVDFESSPAVEKRVLGSPSPVKGRPAIADMMDVTYPSLPPRSPFTAQSPSKLEPQYPNLNGSDTTIPDEEFQAASPTQPVANIPSTFTFRVGTPITFGPAAASSKSNTTAPQSRNLAKPTIRHVRPSIAPSSSRRKSTAAATNSNTGKGKKRKLSASQGDEEKENTAMTSEALAVFDIPKDDDEVEPARPAKKARRGSDEAKTTKGSKEKGVEKKVKTGSRLPRFGGGRAAARPGAGKRTSGILSQARLNLLATPKKRRGE